MNLSTLEMENDHVVTVIILNTAVHSVIFLQFKVMLSQTSLTTLLPQTKQKREEILQNTRSRINCQPLTCIQVA